MSFPFVLLLVGIAAIGGYLFGLSDGSRHLFPSSDPIAFRYAPRIAPDYAVGAERKKEWKL